MSLLQNPTKKNKINLSFIEKNIFGAVVPHAGYMFSAYQAVHFFELLKHYSKQFDTFVIVNPNHTGQGANIALESHSFWETPMGLVTADKEFAEALGFTFSDEAHSLEHSGEVMLPLLQHFVNYDFKIVAVTLSDQNVANAQTLAQRIFETEKKLNRKVCLIASSDFSHFLSPDEGKYFDQIVLDKIAEKNIEGVYSEVRKHKISVCGFGTIMTLMEYSRLKHDNYQSKILSRGHSGEIIPSNEVVDYICILFYQD
ncbi:MAG: AmmeMemoRadiSam system protein B [Bacteroidales bacterium]|nr:AmmeMemoRadiSam system protein B [Bacteroidales bacterium]